MSRSISDETKDQALQTARWTDRYARSRTLGVLIFLALFCALFLSGASLSRAGAIAFQMGNRPLILLEVIALILWLASVIWLSVPRWGGRWMERVAGSLYRNEGHVVQRLAVSRPTAKRWGMIAALLYGTCILASVALGAAGYLRPEMMMPISALYVVPFAVFPALVQRTYLQLLFPVLYTVHALLMLTGVLKPFEGTRAGLNMILPLIGYMALAAVVGHIYNRIAWARMRRLAQADQEHEQ